MSVEFPADEDSDDGKTQGFWIVAQVTRAQCHLTPVRINLKSVSQNALSRGRLFDIWHLVCDVFASHFCNISSTHCNSLVKYCGKHALSTRVILECVWFDKQNLRQPSQGSGSVQGSSLEFNLNIQQSLDCEFICDYFDINVLL